MSGLLPPEMVVRVLNPIIKTGDFPVNQAAIKMLSKLVEKQTADTMEPHVGEVMPGLLKVSVFPDEDCSHDDRVSGVRQCGEQCEEGVRLLYRVPAPAGGRGRPSASPRVSQRIQNEVIVSLHQAGPGSEQCRFDMKIFWSRTSDSP